MEFVTEERRRKKTDAFFFFSPYDLSVAICIVPDVSYETDVC